MVGAYKQVVVQFRNSLASTTQETPNFTDLHLTVDCGPCEPFQSKASRQARNYAT